MAAELGGDGGRVGLHVEHRFEHVAEVADAGAAQVVEHVGNPAPFGELSIGGGIAFKHAENQRRRCLAHADRHPGEFRHRAEIVIAELHVGRGVFIIQRGERLECHKHHRNVHFTHDRAEGGAGGVREHIHEEDVEVRCFDFRQSFEGALRVVDHAEGDDFHLVGGELLLEFLHFRHQFVEQPGKLFPVGVQTDSHQAGSCGEWFSAFDFHFSPFSAWS